MKQVKVGEKLPSLIKHCTLTSMIAYAGATWDWHKVHYDPEFLASLEIVRPIVDGQVFGAYVVQALQDWLGGDAFISELEFRFSQMVFAGESVRVDGEVTQVTPQFIKLDLHIDVIDENGKSLRAAVTPISATVIKKSE